VAVIASYAILSYSPYLVIGCLDALKFEHIPSGVECSRSATTLLRQLRDAPKVGVIFVREQYSRANLNEAIMEIRYRYQYRKSCIGVVILTIPTLVTVRKFCS